MNAGLPTSGRLVVISGPSGAGKSTIVRRLADACSVPLRLSVSATTRKPRPGEIDGVHYHFLTKEQFAERRARGEFLECKEVFGCGDWYGTPESEVEAGFAEGRWMLLEIDVEGAMSVLERFPEAITIFLHAGSIEEMERRLRDRSTETEESIHRRLETASREMQYMKRYTHEVVNHTPEEAIDEICGILLRSYSPVRA